MDKIVRDFRRHYHKTKHALESISYQDPIGMKIEFDGTVVRSESNHPGLEEALPFIVLMRRFLHEESDLHFLKIWQYLLENDEGMISPRSRDGFIKAVEGMNRGPIGIQIDEKKLSPRDIYQLISEGDLFGSDEEARSYLLEIAKVPIAGPLFWAHFYSYTYQAFMLVSWIFSTLKYLEQRKVSKFIPAEPEPSILQCIYCLRKDGPFTSEEHIIPEALGNDDAILPKGYVCDDCNNGILSRLDSALVDFPPIKLLQVQFVTHIKSGAMPKANLQNVLIERTRPNHIRITAKDKSGEIKEKKGLGDGWYSWKMEFRGGRMNPKLLARSLFKIGLGFIALDIGHEAASSARFDHARQFIRGETDFDNYLVLSTNFRPHPRFRVTHYDWETGSPFAIDIFGLVFVFNLEEEPKMRTDQTLLDLEMQSYYLGDQEGE